jgi:tRNA (cmo5U34)-methyltransferase
MTSWTFNTPEIVNKFDDHVREQLPWYDLVTDAVVYIVRNYLTEHERVVDVGASTGNMIEKLMPMLLERKAYATAIESSDSMVDKLVEKFRDNHNVTIEKDDIRTCHLDSVQVHVMFLTMMFIPVHQREMVLNRLRAKTKKGGVIVLVDKVCDHGGYFATVLKRLGMHWKIQQGAKLGEVTDKEMSLAGVQIPYDPAMIPDGKQFFRMGEFAGWVIEV